MATEIFHEMPLWAQASVISAFLGALATLLCVAAVVLEAVPPLYRFLCRVLGDEEVTDA